MCMQSCFSHVWLFSILWTVCSPPHSSVHGILQARTLEWVATPSSRGSSQPNNQATSVMPPALAGKLMLAVVKISSNLTLFFKKIHILKSGFSLKWYALLKMCFSFWRKNMEEVNHSHYFTRLVYWLPLKASQGRHQKTQGSFRLGLTFKVSWVGAKWQELSTCYWLVTGCELTQERGSPEWGDSLQGGKRGWPANSISSSWPASHSLKGTGHLVANPSFHYNSVGLFLS